MISQLSLVAPICYTNRATPDRIMFAKPLLPVWPRVVYLHRHRIDLEMNAAA